MKTLSISTAGLGKAKQRFSFSLDPTFLQQWSGGFAPAGYFTATVTLLRHEGFIESEFFVQGKFSLLCDRSLREFEYPVSLEKDLVFKYAETTGELNDDIILISRHDSDLEVGSILYELIMLAVPMKKLHPDYAQQDSQHDADSELVYSTDPQLDQEHEEPNPIWDKLRSIK